jgi:osmotically-inducible protein OsmY
MVTADITYIKDTNLANEIKEKILTETNINLDDIRIEINESIVTLIGKVGN